MDQSFAVYMGMLLITVSAFGLLLIVLTPFGILVEWIAKRIWK